MLSVLSWWPFLWPFFVAKIVAFLVNTITQVCENEIKYREFSQEV